MTHRPARLFDRASQTNTAAIAGRMGFRCELSSGTPCAASMWQPNDFLQSERVKLKVLCLTTCSLFAPVFESDLRAAPRPEQLATEPIQSRELLDEYF